jgi:hypothetical protein
MDRPWKGTPTPCEAADRQLFQSCAKISVGNGVRTVFWSDRWMDGVAPMDLAPGLFNLARQKQISVADAIREGGWMKGLQRMSTADLLHSFVTLWHKVQLFHVNEEEDKITWTLTANGDYSAKSAL